MSFRFLGSIASVPQGSASSAAALGIWNLTDQSQAQGSNKWPTFSVPITYLVVAGGGAGASGNSGNIGNGGGGAGGILTGSANLSFTATYTINVGGGSTAQSPGIGLVSVNGGDSLISGAAITTIQALGGGSARAYTPSSLPSNSGGSGGGDDQQRLITERPVYWVFT